MILHTKKNYKIILLILCLVGIFYWFQIRPASIRTKCEARVHDAISQNSGLTMTQANFSYDACLHENGI
jgi:preprotein translocase subunit YajC